MEQRADIAAHDGHYIWEPPDRDIAILLNLGLIQRLRRLIRESGDREIGGILRGRRENGSDPGRRRLIIIEEYEPLEPSFNQQHTSVLADALAGARSSDGNVPVGLFRSHRRKGLYLDEADFSVFQEYFSHDSDVFLVARAERKGPPVAGFFFWEDGVLQHRSSYAEFPLDRERLERGGYPILGSPVPGSPERGAAERPDRRRQRLVYGTAGAALIAMALVLAGFMHYSGQGTEESTISLSVQKTGTSLRLSWDPQASAVERANSGVLWITDGGKRHGLELNSDRLKSGTLEYTPESANVDFRLDLLKVIAQGTESVRYIADRGSTEPPTPNSGSPQAPEKPSPMTARTSPSVAPAVPQVIHAPPSVSITTQPVPPSRVREWMARVPLVRNLQRNRYRGGEDFVPPRTLREVMPHVPAKLAKELPGELRMDLKVSLDPSGRVREIDLLSPGADDRLAKVAAEAVRQWRFEPARFRGKAVPSELIATLNFRNPGPAGLVAQRE